MCILFKATFDSIMDEETYNKYVTRGKLSIKY